MWPLNLFCSVEAAVTEVLSERGEERDESESIEEAELEVDELPPELAAWPLVLGSCAWLMLSLATSALAKGTEASPVATWLVGGFSAQSSSMAKICAASFVTSATLVGDVVALAVGNTAGSISGATTACWAESATASASASA